MFISPLFFLPVPVALSPFLLFYLKLLNMRTGLAKRSEGVKYHGLELEITAVLTRTSRDSMMRKSGMAYKAMPVARMLLTPMQAPTQHDDH